MNNDRGTSDLAYLRMAARLALRGHGGAEPNPLVGCVIVCREGSIVGWGYHRRFGGPHAEVVALQRAGSRARTATLYCTLEPCNHAGKTGPCTEAIIRAGIARVVVARRDPNQLAAGGMERLRSAGIRVDLNEECQPAIAVSDPFVHGVRTGLPWVTVKWAQTVDGKIATRTGASQWISNAASRKLVHRERGRVDAILTGIGTVLRDNPTLTARDVRIRRIARRIVIDPKFRIPLTATLCTTTRIAPTIIVCRNDALEGQPAKAKPARDLGVDLVGFPVEGECLSLPAILRQLAAQWDLSHLLVEAGPGLVSRLFRQRLVNEAWVFIGPLLLGDEQAKSSIVGMTVDELTDGTKLNLARVRRRGDDVILRYRVQP
ncbi:MAG: bifunctional diaminohydroxyphosphoribosylaminopyrimidine deaminase/5-amino-6-(5-phosphoribosylamino)uracil reductase RibD [Phycisphaerales bacterium]|nr:bifunctional diaminohydroxyphosphoribosylaminopyrimidine deaminase/5-amino-6-(5-phosphoribosylamino)uracil reductase RibD [Phycisphaerales bacterium]MCI0675679.1 bifunctional diaminohydroxyphosphoribosylaminopyrimidine deaminase/5-amino-6-(5-phosphoribosylamino)uracil reductase RibD [Phycisphaerales bacterium]